MLFSLVSEYNSVHCENSGSPGRRTGALARLGQAGAPVLRGEARLTTEHRILKTGRSSMRLPTPCTIAVVSALLCSAPPATARPTSPQAPTPVTVEFFHEPGCDACEHVEHMILPELHATMGGFFVLVQRDIGVTSNFAALIRYQDTMGITSNKSVSIVVDQCVYLNGLAAIRDRLLDTVEAAVLNQDTPSPTPADCADRETVQRRAHGFTLPAVLLAGLTDGINPCAISTLVFLVSALAVTHMTGTALLGVGLAFALASFLTYTAIGFGLLRFLHLFAGFHLLSGLFKWLMAAVLAGLSFFSFRDAYRYRASGQTDDISLRLPHRVQDRIHRLIRAGLHRAHIAAAAFGTGVLVTALESVCTGQVYVPTLVVLIRQGDGTGQTWNYLLLYNLMFVTPLLLALIAVLLGVRVHSFLALSRRNVVIGKCAAGLFFVLLAVVLVWATG